MMRAERGTGRLVAWICFGAAFTLGGACAHGSDTPGSGSGGGGADMTTTSADGGSGPSGSGGRGDGGNGAGPGAGGSTGGSGGAGTDRACPAGQFMTGFGSGDTLTCATLDALTKAQVNAGCSIYAGSLDSCGACTLPPEKWGSVSGSACANGVGVNDTCTTFSLGGQSVQMFGLNPSGNVDSNDKLFLSLHCTKGESTTNDGPCAADELVSGVKNGKVTCAKASASVFGFVSGACSVYYGISDGCSGCTTPPNKWGFAGDSGCQNGIGANSSCLTTSLGGETVNLFALNPDGDVDDNDKIFLGLQCTAPTAMSSTAPHTCAAGQFVTGVHADGSVDCASPEAAIAAAFSAGCHFYFGWQDDCSGCVTPPGKWGSVTNGGCALGVGVNDTCTTPMLGTTTVSLFGLNFGGDVDSNDKLHFGFTCY